MKLKIKPNLIIYCFIGFFFVLVFIKNFITIGAQQFVIMAEGFIQKRVDMPRLDSSYGNLDTVFLSGKYYWPEPPLPGIILIPFVFIFEKFNLLFYQGYLQFFVTLGVFFVAYKLARQFSLTKINSLFLAFAFCFASIYSFVAFFTEAWYFSQTITVFLFLTALYEWYTKKRLGLIGIYLFCIFLTRATSIFAISFFVLATLFENKNLTRKHLSNTLLLIVPVITSIIIFLGYNYARFGNIFTTGHTINNIQPATQALMREKYGLFRLENISTNIYWYFLAPPQPVLEEGTYHLVPPFLRPHDWGMSFFIMSPIFFLIFTRIRKKMDYEDLFIWVASGLTVFFLLTWNSTGYFQIGPRFLLEVLPLWYILLLKVIKTQKFKRYYYLVIILSSITNLFWILPYR